MTSTPIALARLAPNQLKNWLHDGQEIALLDIREHGQYGEAHLFYATNIPFSRLELDLPRLVPRQDTRLVVYDTTDDGTAERAAVILAQCGYTSVHILAGGATRWKEEGRQLFAGVHVPSKTFGELAEDVFHTPHISAQELKRRQDAGDKLVVLDGRPFSEYRKMSIPGGICCPNGELALRSDQLIPDADTTVVVNCAGRTRSIIGAQTLINLGLPNPVYALQNGTQGWYLADQALDNGANRRYPDTIDASALPTLQERSQRYAERFAVEEITPQTWAQWRDDTQVTTYLFDVRTADEFHTGSIPGAQHAPGGQLIQATDLYAAVRGARLVLFDDEQVRAPVVAGWLRQMGWNACVLRDAHTLFSTPAANASTTACALPELPAIPAAQLKAHLNAGTTLLDIRPSAEFRQAHIAQAIWSNRSILAQPGQQPSGTVILLAQDSQSAALVAKTLAGTGTTILGVNTGSPDDWRQAGLAVIATPDSPPDALCIDFLFFVHDRHHGNREAAKQYLAWETGLLAQIDTQERAAFHLPD